LLFKFSKKGDIVTSYPLNARPKGFSKTGGNFIRIVPMRLLLNDNDTFQDVVNSVKSTKLKDRDFTNFSYLNIINNFRLDHPDRIPTINVMLGQTALSFNTLQLDGLCTESVEVFGGDYRGDMNVIYDPNSDDPQFIIKYNKELFPPLFIDQFVTNFIKLSVQITEKPELKLSEFNLVDECTRNRILYEFNTDQVDCPNTKLIHHIFEEQVDKKPDNIAIKMDFEKLTYRELNERANSLAHLLIKNGVGSNCIVALLTEKSIETVVGMLAILKAGGCYLPIDSDYPVERIEYILMESKATLLLTTTEHSERIGYDGLTISINFESQFAENINNPQVSCNPDDLAYVLYTSGTSGKPKGSMIEHNNVVHLLFGGCLPFQFSEKDIWTMFHSPCFDASVLEIYGALLYGGQLIIIPKMTTKDPMLVRELLYNDQVSILLQTPAPFNNLIRAEMGHKEAGLKLRYVFTGGESLTQEMITLWNDRYPNTKIVNIYGPTETTVFCTYKHMDLFEPECSINNIGKAISTASAYILNNKLELQPFGVPGEVCVGGLTVGRGYLNNPDLTNAKFVQNPFAIGQRLYKTGDLGRLLENGDIDFLGRIDNQVKIRGFRVETGEVESVIRSYENVEEVVVLARDKSDHEKELVCYISSSDGIEIDRLREYMNKKLPEYMVPSYFAVLDEIPLNTSGKTDKNALLMIAVNQVTNKDIVQPTTPLQKELASIWAETLRVDVVGVTDNFFHIGGTSLDAVVLSIKLNDKGYVINIKDIYEHPTIDSMISVIESNAPLKRDNMNESLVGEVPLLPMHRWLFAQDFENINHWNSSLWLDLTAKISIAVLKKAMEEVLANHDTLRSRFKKDQNSWTQIIHSLDDIRETQIAFNEYDLSSMSEGGTKAKLEEIASRSHRSISIEDGPLIHINLIELGRDRSQKLFVNVHHFLGDGYSTRVLFEDLKDALLNATQGGREKSFAKSTNVKKWVETLANYAHSEKLLLEYDYWKKMSQRNCLPIDMNLGDSTIGTQQTIISGVNKRLTAILFSKSYLLGYSVQEVLLTALVGSLSKWTNMTSISLMLSGHGRCHLDDKVDLTRTIGFLAGWYPFTINLNSDKDTLKQLESLHSEMAETPNEGVGYYLLRYYTSEETQNRMKLLPAPEISFNFMGDFNIQSNMFSVDAEATANEIPNIQGKENKTPILIIRIGKWSDELKVLWAYSTNHFRNETMTINARRFIEALEDIVEQIDKV
jgi:amino acid adenylation domain-containing protein/non-ribosomal peptide synthase protein (TIGR01720 family)